MAIGVWATGVWRLERLEGKPPSPALALMQPVAAPAGGPTHTTAPKTPKLPPKVHKTIVKTVVQPPPKTTEVAVVTTIEGAGKGGGAGSGSSTDDGRCIENCVGAVVADPVCGNGALEAGEQCDDGNTTNGDGCSSTCRTEPAPPPVTAAVAPTVLQGLRIAGEPKIHPTTATQTQMLHDGATKVRGVVKLCIATDGSIASATMSVPTKYDDYDATLLAGVRTWRYRPYTVNRTPVPACSLVTFVYTIK